MSSKYSFGLIVTAVVLLAVGCSAPSTTSSTPDVAVSSMDAGAVELGDQATAAGDPRADAAPVPLPEKGPPGHFTVVTDEPASRITWTAIKDGDVKVVGEFTRITGGLFLDPADLSKVDGSFEAHLNAIDSKNPVRDANISEVLFRVVGGKANIASIQIEGLIPEKKVIEVGGSTAATVSYVLGLPSGSAPGEAQVEISRPDAERWLVTSSKPISLSLKSFDMADEAEALRQRCAHKSISDGVEISLSLELVARPPG